jgi:hypothetical protein
VISARKQTFANPISTKRSINIEKAEFGRGRLLRSGTGHSSAWSSGLSVIHGGRLMGDTKVPNIGGSITVVSDSAVERGSFRYQFPLPR